MKYEVKNIEVAIGCVIHDNSILMNKRLEKEILNIHEMWELPGGKIENSETAENAVEREIFEETGYQVEVITPIPFHFNIERKINNTKINVIVNCFVCKLRTVNRCSPRLELKVGEIKWIPFTELEFLQIIAGSREFIYWTLKHFCSINFNNLHNPEFAYIYFENINPIKNHFKKYQITIQFTPTESAEKLYCLSCQYGKIYKKEKTINEYFKDEFSLNIELLRMVNERINHGYNIIQYDNFPLKDWINNHQQYIKKSKLIQQQLPFDHE